MSGRSIIALWIGVVLGVGLGALAAEETGVPEKGGVKKNRTASGAIKPTPNVTPLMAVNVKPPPKPEELRAWLEDFFGAEENKRAVAEERLVEAGSPVWNMLQAKSKGADADADAQRAKALCKRIEAKAATMFRELAQQRNVTYGGELKPEALNALYQATMRFIPYAPQPEFRNFGIRWARQFQTDEQNVRTAAQALERIAERFRSNPEPTPAERVGLEAERFEHLLTCRREQEAEQAAEKALAGLEAQLNRHAPKVLARLAHMYRRQRLAEKQMEVGERLLKEHPNSAEIADAHEILMDALMSMEKWEQAVKQAVAYLHDCPRSERTWEKTFELLRFLEEECLWACAADFAQTLCKIVPLSGLSADVLRIAGVCAEYVAKDYKIAAEYYRKLSQAFPDQYDSAEMEAACRRVADKAAGKFPLEPQTDAVGPVGTFAKFLAAVRGRDAQALKELLAAEVLEEVSDDLTESAEEMVPAFLFADFALVKVDERADKAMLTIEYRPWNELKPSALQINAVGQAQSDPKTAWRLDWDAALNTDEAREN